MPEITIKVDTTEAMASLDALREKMGEVAAESPLALILEELRAIRRLLTAPVLTISPHWMTEGGYEKALKERERVAAGSPEFCTPAGG